MVEKNRNNNARRETLPQKVILLRLPVITSMSSVNKVTWNITAVCASGQINICMYPPLFPRHVSHEIYKYFSSNSLLILKGRVGAECVCVCVWGGGGAWGRVNLN